MSKEAPKDTAVARELYERSLPKFEGKDVHFLEQKLKAAVVSYVGADSGEDLQMDDTKTFLVTGQVVETKGGYDKNGQMVKTVTLEIKKHAEVPPEKTVRLYQQVQD